MQEIQISQLPVTKADIDTNVDAVINQVKEGDINPLKALIEVKAIQDFSKKVEAGIKDYAKDEFENNWSKGEETYYGAKPVVKGLPDKYDYSSDPVYSELLEQQEAIKKAIKEREELMKMSIKSDTVIFDKDGIEIEKPKLLKHGAMTISITLKNK